MSNRLLLFGCLCSLGSGYHSKRQLDGYHWYDQAVLPASNYEQPHQVQDRALFFTPQYQEHEHYRRVEPEQIAAVARVYPVLIQFLRPVPLEPLQHLEPQYQLSLEQEPQYQLSLEQEPNYQRQDAQEGDGRDDINPENRNDTESLQFGSRVTTHRPTHIPLMPVTIKPTTPTTASEE